MNRLIFFTFALLFLTLTAVRIINPVNANTTIFINQTYGGANSEFCFSLVQTVDGGYAMTGYTGSFGVKQYHVWLVKIDELGNHQWNQTYGEPYDDNGGWTVVQTTDGGYAMTGYTGIYESGDCDVWLIKTDASGNHVWNQTYGGPYDDSGRSLVQTTDGGYAILGTTESSGAGGDDIWLIKTDASGNHVWNQTYGGPGRDVGISLVQTDDGGYTLAGKTNSFGAGNHDVWLIKTDASGNHVWNQTYGGPSVDDVESMVQTTDGGYAMAGQRVSSGSIIRDVWLIKTDASGNHVWNQTYGGPENDYGRSLVQTVDGGYAVTGYTWSYGVGSSDIWLIKTDELGNHQWNQTYGGPDGDKGTSLVQTMDGGYAVAGYTGSFGVEQYDAWLVKTDQYGVIPEFPILTPLLLILMIFSVTITICRRKLH